MVNESCPSDDTRCINNATQLINFWLIRSKIEGKDRRIEDRARQKVQKVVGSSVTRALCTCDHGRSAWRQKKIFHRSHSSPRKLSTYGPHRRRPRARRADRTAGTIAAVLPPVETAPIGEKSAGGPPRTAAVAPLPYSRRFFWWPLKFILPNHELIKGVTQNTSWIEFPLHSEAFLSAVECVRTSWLCNFSTVSGTAGAPAAQKLTQFAHSYFVRILFHAQLPRT